MANEIAELATPEIGEISPDGLWEWIEGISGPGWAPVGRSTPEGVGWSVVRPAIPPMAKILQKVPDGEENEGEMVLIQAPALEPEPEPEKKKGYNTCDFQPRKEGQCHGTHMVYLTTAEAVVRGLIQPHEAKGPPKDRQRSKSSSQSEEEAIEAAKAVGAARKNPGSAWEIHINSYEDPSLRGVLDGGIWLNIDDYLKVQNPTDCIFWDADGKCILYKA
jgi:hypothetical protein